MALSPNISKINPVLSKILQLRANSKFLCCIGDICSLIINNLEVYFDKDLELANKFLLRGLPTTVFINKKGEEFARIIGFVNFNDKKFLKWLKKYD